MLEIYFDFPINIPSISDYYDFRFQDSWKNRGGESMETGLRIKAYLDERGISQAFLSSKSKIPAPKLNLALNGKRELTFAEYENICWALGVEADTFIKPRPPEV